MTDLSTLSGAEIDLRIAEAIGAKAVPDVPWTAGEIHIDDGVAYIATGTCDRIRYHATHDLNLAVEAAERLGMQWDVNNLRRGHNATIYGPHIRMATASSPARALCEAILLAKGATK
jgi:hypothetical protein